MKQVMKRSAWVALWTTLAYNGYWYLIPLTLVIAGILVWTHNRVFYPRPKLEAINTLEPNLYVEGIPVFCNSDMLYHYSGSICRNVITLLTPDGKGVIYAPSDFCAWDEIVQVAVLAHELGHIMSGHYNKVKSKSYAWNNLCRVLKSVFGKVDELELEADLAACALIGTSRFVEGMESLLLLMNKTQQKEIKWRIEYIRKNKPIGE